MPKPDITVTLPSGPNTNAMSGGRVTVEGKNTTATVTITGVTAADAGQYTCIATNPAAAGSASATLSVNVHNDLPLSSLPGSAPGPPEHLVSSKAFLLPINTSSVPEERTESDPTFSVPVLVHSLAPEEPESDPDPSLSVLIATVTATAAGVFLLGCIVLTIWWKRWTRNRSTVAPEPGVVYNGTDTTPGVVYNGTDTTPGVVYNGTDTTPGVVCNSTDTTPGVVYNGTDTTPGVVYNSTDTTPGVVYNSTDTTPGVVYNSADTTAGVVYNSTGTMATNTTGGHDHGHMQHYNADA
ncbi:hypothetical protein Bbelb_116400 [Branchiostoma belcheri]|nr:hypothetical protein Bbelb_116400 [Branchiostoma belcheri]